MVPDPTVIRRMQEKKCGVRQTDQFVWGGPPTLRVLCAATIALDLDTVVNKDTPACSALFFLGTSCLCFSELTCKKIIRPTPMYASTDTNMTEIPQVKPHIQFSIRHPQHMWWTKSSNRTHGMLPRHWAILHHTVMRNIRHYWEHLTKTMPCPIDHTSYQPTTQCRFWLKLMTTRHSDSQLDSFVYRLCNTNFMLQS